MGKLQPQLRFTVDGTRWTVERDPSQPGAYHYTRHDGPEPGYGFSSRSSDHKWHEDDGVHLAHIRDFLAQIDPDTGVIDDEDARG